MAGQTTMRDKDEFSQGNLVQFDKKGNMRIFRMDFYNKAVIGDPLVMGRPTKNRRHLEKYSFTRKKALNNAPELSTLDVSVKTSPILWKKDPAWIAVGFPAAADDEFVHHYEVSLSRDGKVLCTKKILADFYKHPDPARMKSSWDLTFTVEDLPEDHVSADNQILPGRYTVSLTAFDSWDAESETLTKEIEI